MKGDKIITNRTRGQEVKKSKTPNVVRAILLVINHDVLDTDTELVKRTRESVYEIADSYYNNNDIELVNAVNKTNFYLEIIKDRVQGIRDKCELLQKGLRYIIEEASIGVSISDIESEMSLSDELEESVSAEQIVRDIHTSPIMSHKRLSETANPNISYAGQDQVYKRESKDARPSVPISRQDIGSIRQTSRKSEIYSYLSDTPQSIKDVSAKIKGCSEKTVQRELNSLLEEGQILRIGEKRWSKYVLNR